MIRIGGEFLAVKDAAIETDDADALFFQRSSEEASVRSIPPSCQAIQKGRAQFTR